MITPVKALLDRFLNRATAIRKGPSLDQHIDSPEQLPVDRNRHPDGTHSTTLICSIQGGVAVAT